MNDITQNEVQIAGESDVALWYCSKCFQSGALVLNRASVYSVIEALENVHRAVSKDLCQVNIGSLRLIKPQGWLGRVRPDASTGTSEPAGWRFATQQIKESEV